MALLRKAIPVIQSRVSGRFLDFRSRCTVFFQVFAHMDMDMVSIKGLWCPPGVPLRSFPTGGR